MLLHAGGHLRRDGVLGRRRNDDYLRDGLVDEGSPATNESSSGVSLASETPAPPRCPLDFKRRRANHG